LASFLTPLSMESAMPWQTVITWISHVLTLHVYIREHLAVTVMCDMWVSETCALCLSHGYTACAPLLPLTQANSKNKITGIQRHWMGRPHISLGRPHLGSAHLPPVKDVAGDLKGEW
jgi:hypothetical protein